MKSKMLSMLGLASRAGRITCGLRPATVTLKAGKSALAVCCDGCSEKSRKEIRFFAGKAGVPVIEISDCTIEELSAAVGRSCGILSVNDRSFADAIIKIGNTGGDANE